VKLYVLPNASWIVRAAQIGAVGDGVADDAPKLNLALSAGDLKLEPGKTYGVAVPIMVPSNRTLFLNGATVLMLPSFVKPTSGDGANINAPVGSNLTKGARILGPGTIDSNKKGLGEGGAARQNGVYMRDASDWEIAFLDIKNCTGYARWSLRCKNGVTRQVNVLNAQIHYEDMFSERMTYEDITSRDGDGDITCVSWLHPVFEVGPCKDIRFLRFNGFGAASVGLEVTGNSLNINENISIEDSVVELTGNGIAIVVAGTAGTKRLRGRNTRFMVPNGTLCTNIILVTEGLFEGCTFRARREAYKTTNSQSVVRDCTVITEEAGVGLSVFGVQSVAATKDHWVKVYGGTISGKMDGASHFPVAGKNVYMEGGTKIFTNDVEIGPIVEHAGGSSLAFGSIRYGYHGFTFRLSGVGLAQSIQVLQYNEAPVPVGTRFEVVATSTGVKTITAGTGATIIGGTTINANGRALVENIAESVWMVTGNVS
jgi:hypothetical protein